MGFLSSIPWGMVAKWSAAGIAGLLAYRAYSQRSAALAASSVDNQGNAGGMSTPLFMGMGGGTQASPVSVSPLGGDGWSSGSNDTSPSDDVLIAQIQKEVALAQIAAQKEIAEKGFAGLYPTLGSGGTAGQPGAPLPDTNNVFGFYSDGKFVTRQNQADIMNSYNDALGGQIYGPELTFMQPPKGSRVAESESVSFIKNALKKGDSGYEAIYAQAKARGYSLQETTSLLNKAGLSVNSAQVDKYLMDKKLPLIPTKY